jgi:hypothetical protein
MLGCRPFIVIQIFGGIGNLVNQQRMKRRLTFISSKIKDLLMLFLSLGRSHYVEDEVVDIKRKSMMPRPNGALLDESEVTSSFDRFIQGFIV